ncbi:EmrA/EmrK family multidrug efflux transporter periplasmic adaptor subunit, partial [Pseudomonas aeruginosa]
HIDPQQLQAHPLRIGLALGVKVDQHHPIVQALTKQPPRAALFPTDVYHHQLAPADKLIERLIEANLAENHHKTAPALSPPA